MEEIKEGISYLMNKMLRRSTISYAVHCSKDTRGGVTGNIKTLQTALKHSYNGNLCAILTPCRV